MRPSERAWLLPAAAAAAVLLGASLASEQCSGAQQRRPIITGWALPNEGISMIQYTGQVTLTLIQQSSQPRAPAATMPYQYRMKIAEEMLKYHVDLAS